MWFRFQFIDRMRVEYDYHQMAIKDESITSFGRKSKRVKHANCARWVPSPRLLGYAPLNPTLYATMIGFCRERRYVALYPLLRTIPIYVSFLGSSRQ